MIREIEDASTKMLKQQETIRNEQAFEKYHLEVKKYIYYRNQNFSRWIKQWIWHSKENQSTLERKGIMSRIKEKQKQVFFSAFQMYPCCWQTLRYDVSDFMKLITYAVEEGSLPRVGTDRYRASVMAYLLFIYMIYS